MANPAERPATSSHASHSPGPMDSSKSERDPRSADLAPRAAAIGAPSAAAMSAPSAAATGAPRAAAIGAPRPAGLARMKLISLATSLVYALMVVNLALLLSPVSALGHAILSLAGSSAVLIAALAAIPGWDLFKEVEVPKDESRFWRVVIAIGRTAYFIGIVGIVGGLIASQDPSAPLPTFTTRLGLGVLAIVQFAALAVVGIVSGSDDSLVRSIYTSATLICAGVVALLMLRAILGWLRLVPKSWRKPTA